MSLQPTELITTFFIDSEMYGLEVAQVQEVTRHQLVKPVPLAPKFVRGLINLRGQIATALGLRELFKKTEKEKKSEEMTVVCKIDGNLVSLIVDSIGDVVEVEKSYFERAPHTIPAEIRKYIKGIYKMNGSLLSVLDLEMISKELSPIADRGQQHHKEML